MRSVGVPKYCRVALRPRLRIKSPRVLSRAFGRGSFCFTLGQAGSSGSNAWQPISCSGNSPEKGIRDIKETSKRADNAKRLAKKLGGEVRGLFWTIGRYDVALIIEAPDDETIAVFGMSAGKLGYVRTETLRAFTQPEVDEILGRLL